MKTKSMFRLRGKLSPFLFLRPSLSKQIICITNLNHLEGTGKTKPTHNINGKYHRVLIACTQAVTLFGEFLSEVASNFRTKGNPWPTIAGWGFHHREVLLPWFPQSLLPMGASIGLVSIVSCSEFNTSSSFSQVQAYTILHIFNYSS